MRDISHRVWSQDDGGSSCVQATHRTLDFPSPASASAASLLSLLDSVYFIYKSFPIESRGKSMKSLVLLISRVRTPCMNLHGTHYYPIVE